LADLGLDPTNHFQIRFLAEDRSPGSVVEAAVDDLEIYGGANATATTPAIRPVVRLLPNQPNPFNPATLLRFVTVKNSRVRLDIHDQRGRRVARVLDEVLAAGEHQLRWDARDAAGRSLASGVYVVRLAAGSDVSVRKIVLAQ
jgi:hypothetical protein